MDRSTPNYEHHANLRSKGVATIVKRVVTSIGLGLVSMSNSRVFSSLAGVECVCVYVLRENCREPGTAEWKIGQARSGSAPSGSEIKQGCSVPDGDGPEWQHVIPPRMSWQCHDIVKLVWP